MWCLRQEPARKIRLCIRPGRVGGSASRAAGFHRGIRCGGAAHAPLGSVDTQTGRPVLALRVAARPRTGARERAQRFVGRQRSAWRRR